MGAATVVVEEDDRGVFCALAGGGDPIPGTAAGGGKAKTGTEIFLVRQIVERFEVQRLETIDLPAFRPPAGGARLFQLEASGLNGGFVLVQAQKSFWQKLSQFFFDGFRLRIQQAAQISVVGSLELVRAWAGAKSQDGAANPRGYDEEGGGKCQGAEDVEEEFVHIVMVPHGAGEDGADRRFSVGTGTD